VNREVVRFGDVVRKVMNKVDPVASGIERYVAGEHMDSDDWRVRRSGSVGDGYLGPAFHVHFQPGQVLYGSRRTYLRKVAVADFEGVCANTTFVLEPATERLDPRYLLYVMSTERFHRNSISLSKGSTNPYINFSDIAPYEFELPSLDEQHRAVELLSASDTHIDSLLLLLDKSHTAARSVLREMTTGGGAGWSSMSIGDLLSLEYGRALKEEHRDGEGFPVFGSSGEVGLHSSPSVDFAPVIIVGRKGNAGSVLWSDVPCSVIDTAYFVAQRTDIDTRFLFLLLQLQDLASRSTQTAVPGLSREAVYELSVDVPPRALMTDVVMSADSFDLAERRIRDSLDAARLLRTSMLNGEVVR